MKREVLIEIVRLEDVGLILWFPVTGGGFVATSNFWRALRGELERQLEGKFSLALGSGKTRHILDIVNEYLKKGEKEEEEPEK